MNTDVEFIPCFLAYIHSSAEEIMQLGVFYYFYRKKVLFC